MYKRGKEECLSEWFFLVNGHSIRDILLLFGDYINYRVCKDISY